MERNGKRSRDGRKLENQLEGLGLSLEEEEEEDMKKEHSGKCQEKPNLEQEFPADLQPLGFNRHVDPELLKNSQRRAAASSRLKERLLNLGVANGRSTEDIIRDALGSIDEEQFEEYLKNPPYIKLMKKGKNIKQFRRLFLAQELRIQDGNEKENENEASESKAIWTNKFSINGKYMAIGSKDGSIWIWKVLSSPIERWEMDYREELQSAAEKKAKILRQHHTGNPGVGRSASFSRRDQKLAEKHEKKSAKSSAASLYAPVFQPKPIRVYREHGNSVLDLDWSPNGFLLSASMDRKVILWHIERENSLKTFLHPDFVTCMVFYPLDDRFFVSGCLDHKCRMWSILDDEVIFEFDCHDLITSMVLTPETGDHIIVGTFNGYIYILETYGLELVSSFHVKDKDTQNRFNIRGLSSGSKHHHGPRVTYLQCFNAPNDDSLKLMTVSNDSRIRIFDLRTNKCVEVLKGFESGASQHSAQLVTCENQTSIVSGSNDHWVYGWKVHSANAPEEKAEMRSTSRSGGSIRRSSSFRHLLNKNKSKTAPEPSTMKSAQNGDGGTHHHHVFHNPLHLKSILKHAHNNLLDQHIKNNHFVSFHAHHFPVTTATVAPPEALKTLSLSNDLICELSSFLCKDDDQLRVFGNSRDMSRPINDNSDESDGEPDGSYDNAKLAFNTRGVSSAVDAIGSILITTDTTGAIRIFRADMPYSIRRRVLDRLEASRDDENSYRKNRSSSIDSLASIQKLARSNSFNGDNRISALTSPQMNNANASTTSPSQNANNLSSQPRPPLRPLRSRSVFRNALLNQSTSSLGSLKRNSIGSNPVERDRARSNSQLGPRPCCDVCGSTRFNLQSSGFFSGRETGHHCADCGTMNNNFR